MHRPLICLGSAILLGAALGCSDSGSRPLPELIAFDSLVQAVDELLLAENDSVINVAIVVTVDPAGGFLVTDAREAQIRSYSPTGELRGAFGRKGDGPAEFTRPVAAFRLTTGGVVVLDRALKAVIFSDDGQSVVKTIPAPFTYVQDADLVNDSTILISGITRSGDRSDRMHLWRFTTGEVLASFFTPVVPESMEATATAAGFVSAALMHDTVAAVYSLADSVYLYTTSGILIETVPFGPTHVRRPIPIPGDIQVDPRAAVTWLGSFDIVHSLRWTEDADFVIQYQTVDSAGATVYRLLHLARDGTVIAEVMDTPKLLTSRLDSNLFYFIHPNSETPDRWLAGALR